MSARQLTVVHFTSSADRGGAEEHLVNLVRGLDKRQFAPIVVCQPSLAEELKVELGDSAGLIPTPLFGPRDFRAVPRLVRLFRRLKVDIVHSHLFCSSLLASPAARFAGARAVIETPHLSEGWRRGWKAHFLPDRLAARAVDAFIAVSEANARYLIDQKRLPPEKVHVILNGIEPARFAGGDGRLLRDSLGIPAAAPVVVSVARLEPQKGHHVLLEAIARLRQEIPAIRLILVGEGTLRNPLEQQVHSLSLEDSVQFVGWQSSVAEWLALADVVALASFYEGLPLAALEALAARRPVVATAVDGTPEVIRDGETGLTVPPGNSEALAGAIGKLLRNRSLAERLARAGRQLIESGFSHSNQVRQTEQLYLDIWEGCRSPHRRREAITQNPSEVPSP